MSILGIIRKNSWLLLVVIGLALFAFVFSADTLSIMSNKDANVVGEVNGEKITLSEFNNTINTANAISRGGISARNLQNSAWSFIVERTLYKQQAEELGIERPIASGKQFWDTVEKLLGKGAEKFIENGVFNPDLFNKALETARAQGNSDFVSYYEVAKSEAKNMMINDNYYEMIKEGLLLTDKEVDFGYESQYGKVNIDYVYVPYSTFEGAKDIKITDDEINSYIKLHQNKFDRPESRDLEYALFEVKASGKDKAELNAELTKYIDDFEEDGQNVIGLRNTNDNKGFVEMYSDGKYSEGLVFEEDDFDRSVLDFAKNASLNEVYGPYEAKGDVMAISKLIAKNNVFDSIDISHILISYKGSAVNLPTVTLKKEDAKFKADSLLSIVKSNPSNFGEIAFENSDFEKSREQKGSLGWFKHNNILGQSPEFRDYVLNNGTGSIGLVETPEGYQIIKINEKKSNKIGYQFANVIRSIEASDETKDSVFNLASRVAEEFNGKDISEIDKISDELNVKLIVQNNLAQFKAEQSDFSSLTNSNNSEAVEQITSWAFDDATNIKMAEKFDLANGNYVVSYIANKNEKGLLDATQARSEIEPILKNQKIGDEIIKKIGTAKSLDEVEKVTGQPTKLNNSVQFKLPYITGIGKEEVVVGNVIGQDVGVVSKPIKGNSGVFVVKTVSLDEIIINDQNKESLKKNMKVENTIHVQNGLTEALKKKSDIEDKRADNPSFK